MNLNDIRVLYWREIRSALRDRTIVTNSILLPMLLYPAIIWLVYTGLTFVSGQNEELKSRIMLRDAPMAHAILKKNFKKMAWAIGASLSMIRDFSSSFCPETKVSPV